MLASAIARTAGSPVGFAVAVECGPCARGEGDERALRMSARLPAIMTNMIPASKIPPALDRAVPVTIDMPIKQPMIHAADGIGERGGFLMLSSPALSYEATAIPGRDKRGPPVSSQNRKESPVFGEERACPLRNRDDVYDHIKDALRGQCPVAPSSALGAGPGGLDGADLNCYIDRKSVV